ncbi:MAG TPA: ATP-binding protein, partial [Thermomonas sp.]|nr:ATP-binding protein [Thermomonas sp.]
LNGDVAPGQYVMVAVSDTGHGIRPELLARVFEPFFTTKDVGKGTGLGLAMVYGFAKQSQGHVAIYSEVERGTTVRLYLPRLPAAHAQGAAGAEARGPAQSGDGELVLLVEDDPMVRTFASAQVASLGYRVLEAATGPEALDLVRAHPEVALLFTDVVMPGGMSGRQLADEARALRPGLPVLYTSGYTENAIVHHGRLDAGVLLLGKPYLRAELADKLRQALAQAARRG